MIHDATNTFADRAGPRLARAPFLPTSFPTHDRPALHIFQLVSARVYHAPTSKYSSPKNVATTVRSANFLPANAASAFCAAADSSYLM